MLHATACGAFTTSTYNEGYDILEKISNNNSHWADSRTIVQRPRAGLQGIETYETLAAQLANVAEMVQGLATHQQVVASINTPELAIDPVQCAYCGEDHFFDACPGNPEQVNFINNHNNQSGPFSQTYNPG